MVLQQCMVCNARYIWPQRLQYMESPRPGAVQRLNVSGSSWRALSRSRSGPWFNCSFTSLTYPRSAPETWSVSHTIAYAEYQQNVTDWWLMLALAWVVRRSVGRPVRSKLDSSCTKACSVPTQSASRSDQLRTYHDPALPVSIDYGRSQTRSPSRL